MTGNKLVYLQRLDSQLLHNPEIEVAVFCLFFFPAQSCRKEKKRKTERENKIKRGKRGKKGRKKVRKKERRTERICILFFFSYFYCFWK